MQMDIGHLHDQWIQIDQSADSDFFIRFLDASRARSYEFARANPAAAYAHLEPQPGLTVLDCGCGTGDNLRLLQPLIRPGRLLGIDFSEKMVEEARRRGGDIEFQRADVQALPFEDGKFDRVTATQLLIHVPDPRKALEEMVRVTAPGGLVAVADMDWDTLVMALDDVELARKLSRGITDGIRNGLVVWSIPSWMREFGLEDIRVLPMAFRFEPHAFVDEYLVEPSLKQFVAGGTFTEEQSNQVRNQFAARDARGAEHCGATYYTMIGRKAG